MGIFLHRHGNVYGIAGKMVNAGKFNLFSKKIKKVTEKIMTEFSDLNLCPINNHQGIVIDGEGSKVICKD